MGPAARITRDCCAKYLSIACVWLCCMGAHTLLAQEEDTGILEEVISGKKDKPLVDTLTYETRAGLPIAASKIYFSDRKFTWSGFGEINYTHYEGAKDRSSQDIELYNTNLYRFVSYLAYKPKPWLILYGEVFAEFFQDHRLESDFEFFLEAFADFLIHERFNVRVGTHQVQIGYVNNNDEPVQFFTVNRPEVERVIIPSQWIDLGIMTYGALTKDLSYSLSVYQGLDPSVYNGGTWIRRGRSNAFRGNFNSAILNGQLEYHGFENTTLSLSGLYTLARDMEGQEDFSSETWLVSSYVRNTWKNWTFLALGSVGGMGSTPQLYEYTGRIDSEGIRLPGQVLGSRVYGYYAEVGYDILPFFRKEEKNSSKGNRFYRPGEMKLPLFVRYEQLNTHAEVHPELSELDRSQTDLTAISVGVNFNPRKNIVFKSNYQFRLSDIELPNGEMEGNRFEVGLGFIF